MKHTSLRFLSLILMCSLCLSLPASAELSESVFAPESLGSTSLILHPAAETVGIALDALSYYVEVSDYVAIREKEDFVYIYTAYDGSIPYIMIGRYDTTSDTIVDSFTRYMQNNHPDLQIAEAEHTVQVGALTARKIVYHYAISDLLAIDTRLFITFSDSTCMLCEKEVPEANRYVTDGYLETIAASIAPLAAQDVVHHITKDGSMIRISTPSLKGNQDTLPTAQSTETPIPSATPAPTANSTNVGGKVGGIAGRLQVQPTATPVNNVIQFTESMANYSGVWVEFEDGFKLYLPADWHVVDPDQVGAASTVLYLAGDASGRDAPPCVQVNYCESFGYTSLEDIARDLEASGYDVEGVYIVNSIPCVSYNSSSEDIAGLMFFHPGNPDYILCVIAGYINENIETQIPMLCSLSLL